MTTITTPNRPSHRVYAVSKKGRDAKGFWTEIGAAWSHADGRGFNVSLNFLPLDPLAEIVIREPLAQSDSQHRKHQ
jgi:hypothetical protein